METISNPEQSRREAIATQILVGILSRPDTQPFLFASSKPSQKATFRANLVKEVLLITDSFIEVLDKENRSV